MIQHIFVFSFKVEKYIYIYIMDGVYVIFILMGVSFVFLFVFLHLGRAISYASYVYNPNIWFSGIIIYFFLVGTAFMGYVLPLGQMSL